jgi:hypothetical protein
MNLPLPDTLVFACLLSCFKSCEKVICSTRLHARRFTSHPLLDRSCIARLEELGAIEAKTIGPREDFDEQDFHVFILGEAIKKPSLYAQQLITNIQKKTKADPEKLWRLEDLLLCLLTGECVEYVHFYAQRNGFVVRNNIVGFKQIKSLLSHCSLGQVNMLLWRAAHNIPKSNETNFVDLSNLTEDAKSYYIHYCQRGLVIQHYDRLKSSKPSQLSNILIYEILGVKHPDHTLVGIGEYLRAH